MDRTRRVVVSSSRHMVVRHRLGVVLPRVVAGCAALACAALAGLPTTGSGRSSLDNCPQDSSGNVYWPEGWVGGGNNYTGQCGDSNGDGTTDFHDYPAFWEHSKQCPNFPTTITPETIIGNLNLIPDLCNDPGPCAGIATGASIVFQDELGRMPTEGELGELDGDNANDGGICEPPTSVPELPGGPGPFWCASADPQDCNPRVMEPPGQECDDPQCGDIIICLGIDCTLPDPTTEVELPTPGNTEPFPTPKPDDGDPSWGPRWFPPGMEPKYEPEPPRPPTSSTPVSSSSDDDDDEESAESESEDDDEPKKEDEKKKDCGGNESGNGEGQGGAQSVSSAPVTLAWGQKSETITDVAVRLTGRDFTIERAYTSDTAFQGPHLVGNNWTLSAFNAVFYGPSGNYLRVYCPNPNRVVSFAPAGNRTWVSSGPSRQKITATYLPGTEGPSVFRITEPGAGSRSYYRSNDSNDPSGYPVNNPALIGLLAQDQDTYGNTANYYYDLFGSGTNKKARLRKIVLNGNETASEAEIRFQWYLVVGTNAVNHPLNGKLARIQVVRFDGNGARYETDRVEYTYKHAGDPFSAETGTNGDLIQAARFSRVDGWVDDGSDYAPSYPHRVLISQYRYHDGNSHSSGDPRLAVSGSIRQLKSVFMPEQLEYYAQKLHRTGVLQHPSLAVRDAAYRLMLHGDASLAFTDDASNPPAPFKVVDIAAKVVGYDSQGRVGTEYLQSSCGCSGGVTQGLRQTFGYSEWTGNTLWPYGGRATKIEEHAYSGSSYSQLHRTLFYDLAPLDSTSTVPYLVNSVIKDPAGQFWITHYKYDSSHRVIEKYTPAAMSQSYTPASGTTASVYSTGTSGLVFVYDYTATHRVKEMSLKDGSGGSAALVTKITYPSADGQNERVFLPSKIERFVEAGTTDQDKIQTTWFEYGFHGSSTTSSQLAWRRTISERERPAENGPETSDTGVVLFTPPGNQNSVVVADGFELFDTRGRLCWIRHADWSLTRRQFAGSAVRPTSIQYNADRTNIDTNTWSLSTTGWGKIDGGSVQLPGGTLTTEFDYEGHGRVTAMRGPGGVQRAFVREYRPLGLDQVNELPGVYYYAKRELPHRLTQSPNTYSGPATISWLNAGGRVVCSAKFTLDGSGGLELPPVSRRTMRYLLAGKLERERKWHDIAHNAYYETSYAYDALGRADTVTHPNGTVVKNDSYDALGRLLQVSIGKVGSSLSPVMGYFYDDPDTDDIAEQGVGNSNLSWTVRYAGENRVSGDTGGTSTEVRTFRVFDFRNRPKVVKSAEAPHFAASYDNLGRAVESGLYTTVPSYTFTGSIPTTDRGVYAKYNYSQRGTRFAALVATNPASPTAYLGSYRWFDPTGRAREDWGPNGARTKMAYDGLGRPITVWTTDGNSDPAPGGQSNYASAVSVTDDVVLEQVELRYDAHGRNDLVTARVRMHNGSGNGSLTDSNSVVAYDGTYFDGADRPIRRVDFGTNQTGFVSGGPSPASTWPPSVPPNWNDTGEQRLVTAIDYHKRGFADLVIDPEGKRTRTALDALGRPIWTIENESSGSVAWSTSLGRWTVTGMSTSDSSLNRVTSFVYTFDTNGAFLVKEFAHHLDSSNAETVQTTQYEYGTTAGSAGNDLDSLVNSGHLLARIRYPDPSTGGTGGDAQSTLYAYDRLGDLRAFRDQNGTVHRFDRDMRGRVIKDRVPTFGADTSIDTRVTAIDNRYDRLGRLDRTRSFQGTTVVNAAELTYNALGQIGKIYQDADAAVSSGSKFIEYAYAISAAGNYARVTDLTYPSYGALSYDYGTSTDSRISRIRTLQLSNLSASVTDLVKYDYVGLDFFAGADLPLIDVQLDRTLSHDGKRSIRQHTSQTQGAYPGWDRFGRVARQVWADGGLTTLNSTLPDRPPILEDVLGHDRTGARTSTFDRRPNAARGDRDSEYLYDGLHRLKDVKRGQRDDSANTWTWGRESQSWDLDMLGNWSKVKTDTSGDGLYSGNYETESRPHDELNELVSKQFTSPPSQPVRPLYYDNTGNLKSHQKAATLTVLYSHDAWGRLTKIRHDLGNSTVRDVAEYQYNGLNWRTLKKVDTDANGTLDQQRRMYYSASWQLLQEDVGSTTHVQYFWGMRHIDDILMHRTHSDLADKEPTYFHITDVQFSTVAILDEGGRLQERTRYQAYGQGDFRWPGDFNRDGDVNDTDYDEIKAAQGLDITSTAYEPDLDLNRDGQIDDADFALFDSWYGKSKSGGGLISDAAGPDGRVGYAGYVFNPEAMIYTVRHRHYEPMLGRFMEQDWLGYVDGMNTYEYAGGQAMNFVDPSGLTWLDRQIQDLFAPGGASSESIDESHRRNCDQLKSNYESGKICKDDFEKNWKNMDCAGDPSDGAAGKIAAAAGEGAHDGLILDINNLTFGYGFADAAKAIRTEHAGDAFYIAGDIAGKIGAFAAHSAAFGVIGKGAGALLGRILGGAGEAYHYTTAANAARIATSNIIFPSRNGLVYATTIAPELMAKYPLLSILIGRLPSEVTWAVRVTNTSSHWVPWFRVIRGGAPLAGF
jgi:RHS repeat-associated protein